MSARLTEEQKLYRSVTEKAWQAQVVEILQWHGWRVHHVFDSRRSEPGWPDLFAIRVRDGDRLVAELKTETGTVSMAQLEWLGLFELAGITNYVWRPSDVDVVISRAAQAKA